jgi:DNA-binding MarR family transcriptional regulator
MTAKHSIGDSSVFFKLIRLVNLAARPFNENIAKQHHITLNEWRVMVVLASHPGCVATDVVSFTGLDKMNVSRALLGLTKLARVKRAKDPLDARRAIITLTTKGATLFSKISASASERETQLFTNLDKSDLARFETTIDHLTQVLSRLETE